MNKPIGLYIHVPYCAKKCDYCDFYSLCDLQTADRYVEQVAKEMNKYTFQADTLYFGGGTPSQLSVKQINRVLSAASPHLTGDAEITMEMNPGDCNGNDLRQLAALGINRISLGVQSTSDAQLRQLGRRHNFEDVKRAINKIRQCGINHLSVDLMLGIEGQTEQTLTHSIRFVAEEAIPHVSAYLLKIEENTPFYDRRDTMKLPDEDQQAQLYLSLSQQLREYGYDHYEISNFCKDGQYSRHNLKYWNDEEYLGIGPAAHSYFMGKRFYYPRDLHAFLEAPSIINDGDGGSEEEYLMLRLRLGKGVTFSDYRAKYPQAKSPDYFRKIAAELGDLVICDDDHFALTPKGFLVSNAIIGRVLEGM